MRDHRDPKLCIEICCFHWAKSCSVKTLVKELRVFNPKIETQNTKENSGQMNPEKEDSVGEISESEKNTGYKGPMDKSQDKSFGTS